MSALQPPCYRLQSRLTNAASTVRATQGTDALSGSLSLHMTAAEYESVNETSDMCLGSQLDTAPVANTPLLAAIVDDEHDERIPVYIEVMYACSRLQNMLESLSCIPMWSNLALMPAQRKRIHTGT